jgi:hypothetical protein
MAIVYAVATGNWSSPSTWNTGTLPTSADDVFTNNFTVTINQNVTVLSLSNRATTGVNAGGIFTFNGNFTVVCDTISAGSDVLRVDNLPHTITITANTIQGIGGRIMQTVNYTGTLTINGNIFASTTTSSNGINFFGNSGGAIGTYIINGNVTSGITQGLDFTAQSTYTQVLTVNGFVLSSASAVGLNISSVSNLISSAIIQKAINTNNGLAAVLNPVKCFCSVKEIEQGDFGVVPIQGFVRLSTASGAFFKGMTTGSSTRTLTDVADIAGQVPAQSDVRFGVTYQSGAKTGTAYIPSPSSVGFGVPVDNTTGTASLTPTDVWTAATSALTTPGSIGERLKNASTVDSTGDQLAALL